MMKQWIERLEGRIREKRPGTGLPDSGCEELIKIVNLCKVYDTGTMKVIGLRGSLWRSWGSPVPENPRL